MKETTRTKKVAKLIQKELGIIFQQDSKHLLNQAFITVTEVKLTPDLLEARVYLSFFPDQSSQQGLENLENNAKAIRKLLAARIGKQMRAIPQLKYFLDTLPQEAQKINALLDTLHIPPAQDNED